MPRVPYNFPLLALFVGRLMDRLGYDVFDVLGISWGGGLAQQIAFQHPRRCRRLVLVSTGTGMLMVPARPGVLSKMLTPRRYRDPEYAKAIASELYGGQMRRHPSEVRHVVYEPERLGPKAGYYLQLLAGLGWSSLPALPLIRQPTLILAGADDPMIPTVNARIMGTLLPHASVHVYDDGHLGLITSADELGPLVSAVPDRVAGVRVPSKASPGQPCGGAPDGAAPCFSSYQPTYACTAVGSVMKMRSSPTRSRKPEGRRSSCRSCLTRAIAKTMPRRSSSWRSSSRASIAVMSTWTLASALSTNHSVGVSATSIEASARRLKSSTLAKNSGES